MDIDQAWKKVALELALQAGEIMLANFDKREKEWKEDQTPITIADRTINALVLETIKKHFPAHGIIAEEGNDFHDEEFVWVCDPLDGTIPFSLGIPVSTFSLALTQNGQPMLATVYDPFTKRMFVSEKDGGARMNETSMQVSSRKSTDTLMIAIGGTKKKSTTNLEEALLQAGHHIINPHSTVNMAALVAFGQLDGIITPARSPWDIATTWLLIRESGGTTTDLSGQERQDFRMKVNGMIGGNKEIHAYFLDLAKQHITF